MDETYRKAAKLDVSKFAISFDPLRCGLISTIKDQLLEYSIAKAPLDCELSKLNVYGKTPPVPYLLNRSREMSAEPWD